MTLFILPRRFRIEHDIMLEQHPKSGCCSDFFLQIMYLLLKKQKVYGILEIQSGMVCQKESMLSRKFQSLYDTEI